MRYSKSLIDKAKSFRLQGKPYFEINNLLGIKVPKATMSFWFKDLILSAVSHIKLKDKVNQKLAESRIKTVLAKKEKRLVFKNLLDQKNLSIANDISKPNTAKIALAMLCLGEASKYGSSSCFYLGNSDHKIIVLFVKLLEKCYPVDKSKFRFTVQCRADQSIPRLERYWRSVLNVNTSLFYPARIDPRTVGKPTMDKDYKGVLRVDYLDKKVQLDLESLADMLYNKI